MADNTPQTVTYGATIRIRHVATGALLSSLDRPYIHPGTSHQYMVGGTAKCDESTMWLVKPPDAQKRVNLDGRQIPDGSALRLEHKITRRNLHSHNIPAPLSGSNQYEVTAFYDSGPGDGNIQDDWVLSLTSPGEWVYGKQFRLRHSNVGGWALHSHGIADPHRTGGLFEVTSVPRGDANDLFIAESIIHSTNTDSSLTDPLNEQPRETGTLVRLWQACLLVAATAGITWVFVERAFVEPLKQQMEIQKTMIDSLDHRLALVKDEREAQRDQKPESKTAEKPDATYLVVSPQSLAETPKQK